jgi:hypothetical protein
MPASDLSLYAVKSVLILDNEGNRLFAKYYKPPHENANINQELATVKEQKTFEKGLFQKTSKGRDDVIIYESKVVVYKAVVDIIFYVIGDLDENEAMLFQVLQGLRDAIEILLKYAVEMTCHLFKRYSVLTLGILSISVLSSRITT